MGYEIKRLTDQDRGALAEMLNFSFTGDAHSGHFENGLPKMWVTGDDRMKNNIALIEDGAIVAMTGVYPYEVSVAGQLLRFATVGNIAVHPEYRGRGYMQLLMDVAMRQLQEEGFDASRLGGLRSRYEIYGYEPCGTNYTAMLTERNVKEALTKSSDTPLTFVRVEPADTVALQFIRNLYEQNLIHVKRGDDRDLYATLCAWSHIPYLAMRGQEPIGYLCATPNGSGIAEYKALCAQDTAIMLYWWVLNSGCDSIQFSLYPWDKPLCRLLSAVCESITAVPATHFKILHWDRVLEAALKLKADTAAIPDGTVALTIQDYGTLRLNKTGTAVSVEKTKETAAFVLDPLTASRFLFGMMPPDLCALLPEDAAELLGAWLPLPLSWNGQDRV